MKRILNLLILSGLIISVTSCSDCNANSNAVVGNVKRVAETEDYYIDRVEIDNNHVKYVTVGKSSSRTVSISE